MTRIIAGRMTYWLNFQRKSVTIDDFGASTVTWTDVFSIRAERLENLVSETIVDNTREADKKTLGFRIRYVGTPVSEANGYRVEFEGERFEILSMKEFGRKRGLDIKLIKRDLSS